MYWAYVGHPLSSLSEVIKEYKKKARKEDGITPLAPATMRNRIEPPRLSWRPVGVSQTGMVCRRPLALHVISAGVPADAWRKFHETPVPRYRRT